MTYLENSQSLNPLKDKASVKMDGALKQGVIASIEYALQIRLVRQKCLTNIHNHPYVQCMDAPFFFFFFGFVVFSSKLNLQPTMSSLSIA